MNLKEKLLHIAPIENYSEDEDNRTFLYKDVKDAIEDYLFILDCWDCITYGENYNEIKLEYMCNRYILDLHLVKTQDISHQELVEHIFGDWKK